METDESEQVETEQERKSFRPGYLVPLNTFDKAEEIFKIIGVGRTLGFCFRRDLITAMRLKKGQLIKARLENIPSATGCQKCGHQKELIFEV